MGKYSPWSLLTVFYLAVALAAVLILRVPVAATSYHSVAINGTCASFSDDERLPGNDGVSTYLTWDATNLYIGWVGGTNATTHRVAAIDLDPGTDNGVSLSYTGVSFPAAGMPDYLIDYANSSVTFSTRTGSAVSSQIDPAGTTSTFASGSCNGSDFAEIAIARSLFSGGSVSGLAPTHAMSVYAFLNDPAGSGGAGAILGATPQSSTCNPSGTVPQTFNCSEFFPTTDIGHSPNTFGRIEAVLTTNTFAPTDGTTLNDVILSGGTLVTPASGTITVAGTFKNSGGTFTANGGTVAFTGTSAQHINGVTTFAALTIDNPAGVILDTAITVNQTLTLTRGVFTIGYNGRSVTLPLGATVVRAAGSVTSSLHYTTSANITYVGATPITTGPELSSAYMTLDALTFNNTGGVTLATYPTANTVSISPGAAVTTGYYSTIIRAHGAFTNNGTFTSTSSGPIGSPYIAVTLGDGAAFTNTGTFSVADTVLFSGTTTVTGTVTFTNVTLNGFVDFGTGATVAGTMILNGGGGVTGHPPSYSATSTLWYTQTSPATIGAEWTPGVTVGPGVPNAVKVGGQTTISFPATAALWTARGSLNLFGTLALSTQEGSDLQIGGDVTLNGGSAVTANGRALVFNGTTRQRIYNFNNSAQSTIANITVTNPAGVAIESMIQVQNLKIVAGGSLSLGDQITGPSFTISDGGTITNNGTFAVNGSAITFAGAGTVTGPVAFEYVIVNGAVDFGSNATINTQLTFLSSGSAILHSPFYGPSAKLVYQQSSAITTGPEWQAGLTSGAGVPQDVEIDTTVSFGNVTAPHTLHGSLTLGGTLQLSPQLGGDLNVGGGLYSQSHANALITNGRTLAFNGGREQSVIAFYDLPVTNVIITSTTTLIDQAYGRLRISGTLTNQGKIRSIQPTPDTVVQYGLTGVTIDASYQIFPSIQVDRVDTSYPTAPGDLHTGQYWTVTPMGTGPVSITVPLPHGVAPATAQVCVKVGDATTWDCGRSSSTDSSVTRTEIVLTTTIVVAVSAPLTVTPQTAVAAPTLSPIPNPQPVKRSTTPPTANPTALPQPARH